MGGQAVAVPAGDEPVGELAQGDLPHRLGLGRDAHQAVGPRDGLDVVVDGGELGRQRPVVAQHPRRVGAQDVALEGDVSRIGAQKARRLRAQPGDELLGGLHHGHAGEVGARARIGAGVEGGHVGVHPVHHDAVEVAAERLGGELGEDGVAARAHVRGADGQRVEARLLEAQVNRGDIDAGDGGALHGQGDAQAAHAVPHVAAELLALPADHLHGTGEAGRRAAGVQRVVVVLRHDLALAHEVLEADLAGVHAKLVGELVDGALDREEALRGTVAAVGAGRHGVGVDDVEGEAAREHAVVQRQALVAGQAHRGGAVLAVGALVGQGMEVERQDRAVAAGADAHAHLHLVARVGRGERLLARVDDLAGAPGHGGDERGEDLHAARLLGAEAAADAGLHHAHPRLRDVEGAGDHAPHVEGHLRGGGHREAAVGVDLGEGAEGLHHGLRVGEGMVGALEDDVGRGEGGIEVAVLGQARGDDVAHAVVPDPGAVHVVVVLRVDDARVVDGLREIEHRLHELVVDPDQAQRAVGGVGVLGGDDGDLVAHVAHDLVQDQAVVGARLGVGLAGEGEAPPRHVAIGVDRDDPGHLEGARGVDGADLREGVRAVEDLDDEGVRRGEVVGEDRLALEQGRGVLLDGGGADLGEALAHVARAAAEVAGQAPVELLVGGHGARRHDLALVCEDVHDEAGRAEAALLGALLGHAPGEVRGLLAQALERRDGVAVGARHGDGAREHRAAVQPHRAQAAVGGLAGALHRLAAVRAHEVVQRLVGGDARRDLPAVQRHLDIQGRCAHAETSSSAGASAGAQASGTGMPAASQTARMPSAPARWRR